MPSGAKPTLAARVEDKFICIIPCKKEENEVKSRPKEVIFYDKRGQLSLLKLPSGAKPTLVARVEDKFICIIPCRKEKNKVKS